MLYKKLRNSLLLFALLLIGLASCEKEYSYEGGNTVILPVDSLVDSIPVTDTLNHGLPEFSSCVYCNNNNPLKESTW